MSDVFCFHFSGGCVGSLGSGGGGESQVDALYFGVDMPFDCYGGIICLA